MPPKLILTLILAGLWSQAETTQAELSTSLMTSNQLSYRLPQGSTPRAVFTRNFSCYVFDALAGTHNSRCSKSFSGAINTEKLPPVIFESLRGLTNHGLSEIGLDNMRTWWNTWAYQVRNLHVDAELIPENLTDFIRLTNFKGWPKTIVKKSHVKNKTRVIYRFNDPSQNLSVSETLESVTGDLNASVLETEVVLQRADGSGHHDFFVYDIDGNLANSAQFPAGERPAPSTCMSCHYSGKSGKFERVGR